MTPINTTNDNLPPTVVEIRCPCRKGFSIRTKQPTKTRTCSQCLAAYEVHLHPNGAVTVYRYPPNSSQSAPFPREHYSIVTEGE